MVAQSPTTGIANSSNHHEGFDWIEALSIIWLSRKRIAYVTAVVTILSIVISLILPPTYKSVTTLLPETEKSRMASLGGLSDLAALAGVSVGGEGSFAKLYPMILKSEILLKDVIYSKYRTEKFKDPVTLIDFWEIEEETPERSYEVAVAALRNALDIKLDIKTDIVTASIETREAQLSADILNNVIGMLDRFIRTKKTTSAGQQRKFIEARLVEVKSDLEKAENTLKEFREKNRRVSDSPQLLLQQERLIREVEINTTVYIELKKQYEIVKIEEIKNLTIVSVLDEARPAAHREGPRRRMMVSISFAVSLMLSIISIVTLHIYGHYLQTMLEKLKSYKTKTVTLV